MSRTHAPRCGSMAYSPRKRAKRIYPSLSSWPQSAETKLLGFAGYKAGMTHLFVFDERPATPTSNMEVFTPCTVLDCPPLFPFIIRAYKKTPYGLVPNGEIWSEKIHKDLNRKLNPIKKPKTASKPLSGDILTIIAHTLPRESSTPSKKPEIMEYYIGGSSFQEKFEYAKSVLGKEMKVTDLVKPGDYVDVVAVTKGKGYQGPVKRFGVKIQNKKAIRSGKGRHVGSLGDRSSATRFTVPMAGQMGYHKRTDFNKRILMVGAKGSQEVTPKGGFVNYGKVKNDFLVLKGSIPGPAKRLVRIRPALRKHPKPEEPKITYVSLESKQGR